MPARLFGRDAELTRALAAFDRVEERGELGMLWVHGDAGVGKTALVDALRRARPEASWASAKFVEDAAPLPFGAALGMLSSLLRERLAESEEALDLLARRMHASLGGSAAVLTAVVPELARLVGQQAPTPVVDAREGEGRFRVQLERALEALAEPDRPLALVFDDLQWADPVHLRLLQGLASSGERSPLFVVGVWRDHVPLPAAFVALRQNLDERGIATHEEVLLPLAPDAMRALVVDRAGGRSDELEAIVLPRARGNPLLAEALLAELERGSAIVHTEGLVRVDAVRLEALPVDAGLGALLAARIGALDDTARGLLSLLSWFSSGATAEELAHAAGIERTVVAAALDAAAELGLVTSGPRFGFLHDRIRELARPSPERTSPLARTVEVHLAGPGASPTEAELYLAADLVPLAHPGASEIERDVAVLREAGRRAHAAGDFTRAVRHLRTARDLIRSKGADEPSITLDLAEALVAEGLFTEAESVLAGAVMPEAADRARAHHLAARALLGLNQPRESVDASRAALEALGVAWQADPAASDVIDLPDEAALAALPLMTAGDDLLAMRILGEMVPPTVTAAPEQVPALTTTALRLTLERGLSAGAAPALVTLSIGEIMAGELTRAHAHALAALSSFTRCPQPSLEIRTAFAVHSMVAHWVRPVRESYEGLLRLRARGLEVGDIEFACYAAVAAPVAGLVAGQPLASMRALAEAGERLALGRGWGWVTSWTRLVAQLADDLTSAVLPERPLAGPGWSSEIDRPKQEAANYLPALALDHLFSAWVHAVAGRWHAVGPHLAASEVGVFGLYTAPLWTLLRGVAAAACQDRETATFCRERVAGWTREAPSIHGHRFALLDAELAEDPRQARESFEKAVALATPASDFERGLVFARYATWLDGQGEPAAARALRLEGERCYRAWGVRGRVEARPDGPPAWIGALEQPDGGVQALAERLRARMTGSSFEIYSVETGLARAVLRADASGVREVDALVDQAPEAVREAVRLAYHGNLVVEREHPSRVSAVPLRRGAAVRAVVVAERDRAPGPLDDAALEDVRLLGALWLSAWERRRAREELRRLHGTVLREGEARAQALEGQQQMRRELEQSRRLETVGRLTASVAHDLNNIVTVFAMCAELLGDAEGLRQDTQHEISEELVAAVRHSTSLTRQLLALSRPPQTRDELVRTDLALAEIERLLRRLVAPVELTVALPREECPVTLDRGAFEQIVLNLALNARDAMPEGGPLLVRLVREANLVVLEVRDRGHGMDEATRRRIFEPFFTTKGPSKGTGLGLATVHAAVERAGGRIDVESQVGRGTTIFVRLPLASQQAVLRVAPRTTSASSERSALLLEADEALRRLIGRLLERRGFVVTSPADEAAAEEAVRALEGPVLVIDGAGTRWPHVEVALDRRRKHHPLAVLRLATPDEPVAEADRDIVVQKPLGPGALDEALTRVEAARAGISRAS